MWLANIVLKTKVGGNVVKANHHAFEDGIKARMVHGSLPLQVITLTYCSYLSHLQVVGKTVGVSCVIETLNFRCALVILRHFMT